MAMKALESEGVLTSTIKKRRVIVRQTLTKPRAVRPATLTLLAPSPLEQMQQRKLLLIDTLRQSLSQLGIELRLHVSRQAFSHRPGKALVQAIEETPASCWLLIYSTREIQEWFDQHGLPAVVLGSCFKGVRLNSVDLDYRAIGRHAAGKFLSLGHTNLCLVNPKSFYAGDRHAEIGFREAVKNRADAISEPVTVLHDGTPGGVKTALKRILQTGGKPTAYFVTGANYVVTVVSTLMQEGLVLGKDYSLIAHDEEPFLTYFVPSIPYYKRDHARFSKAAFHLIRRMLEEPGLPVSSLKIMSDFVPGDALTRPVKP